MSFEPFIYLILLLILWLLSFVARWLKREIDGSADRETEAKVRGLFQESPAPRVYEEVKTPSREKRISQVFPITPPRPRGLRKTIRIQPGNLQEMRRGIVLMTVLGPCRALEPPNESLRF